MPGHQRIPPAHPSSVFSTPSLMWSRQGLPQAWVHSLHPPPTHIPPREPPSPHQVLQGQQSWQQHWSQPGHVAAARSGEAFLSFWLHPEPLRETPAQESVFQKWRGREGYFVSFKKAGFSLTSEVSLTVCWQEEASWSLHLWGAHLSSRAIPWVLPRHLTPTSLKGSVFSWTQDVNPLESFIPPLSYYVLVIWGLQSLRIVITKFSLGFHLIFILNSSNSFIGTETLYNTDMKDVKITCWSRR